MITIVSLDALLEREAQAERDEESDEMTVDTCSQAYIDTILCDTPDEDGLTLDGRPIEDDLPSLMAAERRRRRAA